MKIGRWGAAAVGVLGTACAVGGASNGSTAETEAPRSELVMLAPAEVRADFEAGIEALHDFWYGEASRRFRSVQERAPAFTLGYWGEALSLHANPFGFAEPPTDLMRAVLDRLAPDPGSRAAMARTEQERGYLAALEVLVAADGTPGERHPSYAAAMHEHAAAFPTDVEALAFSARATLLEAPTFGLAPDVQARVVRASRAVLLLDPDHHGGLHYLLHGLDHPRTASEGIEEADRYQRLARGASHAVHMPSHIYMQLGMWDEVIAGNERALAVSEEWLRASGGSMEHVDHHAIDFLIYGLLQQGREADAAALLERTRLDRIEFDSGALRWYDALWSARYAMEVGARSSVPLPRSGYGSVGESLALGLHALARDERAEAEGFLSEIEARVEEDGDVAWRIAALELAAALDRSASATTLLREAIALQSDMVRPNETPDLPKPPEELLGEILLELDRPADAIEAFEGGALRWPGRLATKLGIARARSALADPAAAEAAWRAVADQLRNADAGHPARREARRALEALGVR